MRGSRSLGPAVATIDLGALRENAAEALRLAGGRPLIAVVKADAYGHGAAPVARVLCEAGAGTLATWSVGEAASLRDAGIEAPLLALAGPRDDADAEEAAGRGIACAIGDEAGRERLARAASARGVRAAVHVEIDTGMRRMGAPAGEGADLAAAVAATPVLELAGLMTHFARADEADLEPTREQLRGFRRALDEIRSRGATAGPVHVSNSAGLVARAELGDDAPPEDAVRPGLLLYGAQPSQARRASLRPVMSLRAPVAALRRVRRGEAVGYEARWHAPRDTRVATLAIGYADGVPISATGEGRVWLAGGRRPFAGRVSMDFTTVDVGEAPVRLGDEAVLFGCAPGGEEVVLPVEEAARAAQTISYELLVRVGARVRRVHTDGGAGV